MPESVRVSIYDQTYSLRSQRGAEHMQRIAQLVDERMRQIAAHATNFDLARIAVLAALNIADELATLKAYYEQEILSARAASSDYSAESETAPESTGEPDSLEAKNSDRPSWFEAIFDDTEEAPAKNRGERLSSQISAKLQSLRQTDTETVAINVDEKDER